MIITIIIIIIIIIIITRLTIKHNAHYQDSFDHN